MTASSPSSSEVNSPPKPSNPFGDRAVLFSFLLTGIVFAVDLCLPLGVASAVPYTFAVWLAIKARSPRMAPGLALLCSVLTFAKVFILPERGTTELWKVIANRFLALFAVWMTVFLGLKRRRADEEKQRVEEQIRQQLADLAHMGRLKTAGQLAASLAHELNQPLVAVSLQSEIAMQLAQGKEDSQSSLRTALQEITEQAQRASAILRTLRNMIQKSEPQRLPVDLDAMIRDVERLIDSQARRLGVYVRLRLVDTGLRVMGDKIQLEQVLLNLLQNALDSVAAADAGSRIVEVESCRDREGRVRVSVRDTGVGLPADVDRVFERFYTTKPNGMGMGLAICRSIVEAHDGRLWATPNHDRGATFTFTLPELRSS